LSTVSANLKSAQVVACSCYPLHFFRECREAATITAMLPQTANLCVVSVSAIVELLVF
jgi:hypothetical protein